MPDTRHHRYADNLRYRAGRDRALPQRAIRSGFGAGYRRIEPFADARAFNGVEVHTDFADVRGTRRDTYAGAGARRKPQGFRNQKTVGHSVDRIAARLTLKGDKTK